MIKLCIADVTGVSAALPNVDSGITPHTINTAAIITEMIKTGVSFFID